MGLSPLKMAYTLWSMFLLWLLLYSEKTPMPLDCFGKTEKKYSKLLIVNILKVGYLFHTFLYFTAAICITSMILKIRYTLNLRKIIIFVLESKKGMLKEQKKKHLFCTRNYIIVNYHSTPKIWWFVIRHTWNIII